MFHVEQNKELSGRILNSRKGDPVYPILCYSVHLLESSSRINLTGFRSLEEVVEHLMADSIQPLSSIHVPRGTCMLDMGTGAGIPGVPLAIWHPAVDVICLDSTAKKARFVERTARFCGIENVHTLVSRAETLGREPEYRESFDWVVSRAMAPLPVAMECASGLLKTGGYAFFYGESSPENQKKKEESLHLQLGMAPVKEMDGISVEGGKLFRKNYPLDERYPRSWPAMKRDMQKIGIPF